MTNSETALVPVPETGITPAQYEQAISYAHLKAATLKKIVDSQGLYVEISGRRYLNVEAWITIAQGYGYDVDIEWTRPMDGGGWEARALVRNPQGEIVGHAESECGTTGDTKWLEKPSFQQRSMAQTRAMSKVLAAKLRWVVVLAGYAPTPVEEMEQTKQGAEPERVGLPECPIHEGVTFKQFTKDGRSWFSHSYIENGETKWCNKDKVMAQAEPTPAPAKASLPLAKVGKREELPHQTFFRIAKQHGIESINALDRLKVGSYLEWEEQGHTLEEAFKVLNITP